MQKRFSKDISDTSKNCMLGFEIFEKIAIFCFFVGDYWEFSAILKKSASRFRCSFFEAFLGLKSLQGLQLNTDMKKVTYRCFRDKTFWGDNFFYFWAIFFWVIARLLLLKHDKRSKKNVTQRGLMKLAGCRCVLLWYFPMVMEWCSGEVISVCYSILCQVTRPTEISRRPLRTCLFIRLKTDTFGHALLQHSLLQVGDTGGVFA